MTRAPQGGRDALVEHPADRQVNDTLAEALRKPIEPAATADIVQTEGFLQISDRFASRSSPSNAVSAAYARQQAQRHIRA